MNFSSSQRGLLRLYHADCFAVKTCSDLYDDSCPVCSQIACHPHLLRSVTFGYELCLDKVALVSLSILGASPLKDRKHSCECIQISLTYFCAFLLWDVKIPNKW